MCIKLGVIALGARVVNKIARNLQHRRRPEEAVELSRNNYLRPAQNRYYLKYDASRDASEQARGRAGGVAQKW
jgi:hypothetical protein